MRFRDMHMRGTASIVEQLCEADQFLAAGMRRMDFGLRKYVSISALAIRNIAAGPDRYTRFHAHTLYSSSPYFLPCNGSGVFKQNMKAGSVLC